MNSGPDEEGRGVVLGVDRTLGKQVLRDGPESAVVGFGDRSESRAKLPKLSKRALWFQSIFLISLVNWSIYFCLLPCYKFSFLLIFLKKVGRGKHHCTPGPTRRSI